MDAKSVNAIKSAAAIRHLFVIPKMVDADVN
jgi:hypothetical protein